jgi:hypothetical protein
VSMIVRLRLGVWRLSLMEEYGCVA